MVRKPAHHILWILALTAKPIWSSTLRLSPI